MLKNFLVIREGTIKAMIKKKKVIEKSMEIISSILCQRHDMQFDNLWKFKRTYYALLILGVITLLILIIL